ncbi:hypothetical protein S83_020112, partial [Arachis hypogaea]
AITAHHRSRSGRSSSASFTVRLRHRPPQCSSSTPPSSSSAFINNTSFLFLDAYHHHRLLHLPRPLSALAPFVRAENVTKEKLEGEKSFRKWTTSFRLTGLTKNGVMN